MATLRPRPDADAEIAWPSGGRARRWACAVAALGRIHGKPLRLRVAETVFAEWRARDAPKERVLSHAATRPLAEARINQVPRA